MMYSDGKRVWLSQQQTAELFGVGQAAISKHLKNIYASGELEADGTYSILEYMVGNRVYSTRFYNLDVIISVGYRVNSVQATHFRRWATTKLREIMLAELVRRVKYKRLEDRVGKVEDGLAEETAEDRPRRHAPKTRPDRRHPARPRGTGRGGAQRTRRGRGPAAHRVRRRAAGA